MKITADIIESTFFNFVYENGRSPSRKEIVHETGTSGSMLLEILGEHSKNLEATWRLDEIERETLGQLINENDKSLHMIKGPISFLPVWSSQCRVMNK